MARSAPFAQAAMQGTLAVDLVENPFICDGGTRPLGGVFGLQPGEDVRFSSPELGGVFSNRVAESDGSVSMVWSCDSPKDWTVTVTGRSSGRTVTFSFSGAVAPPPPDAPLGTAFDAKSAMTLSEMAAWKTYSPFNTAGVYIDVDEEFDNRADKVQTNLTRSWVDQVFAAGWRLIPIYVGLQAPQLCRTASYNSMSADPDTARSQGFAAAADAVRSVQDLGMGQGTPIYYDLEGYRPGCTGAIIAFLDGWTEGLHGAGYVSGLYGSRTSAMTDVTEALGRSGFDEPDAVWVSTGSGVPTLLGLETPPDSLWTNARMHQYRLNVTRTYGGVTRQIDENMVDAPLAIARPIVTTVDTDGDGLGEPEPDNCDGIANPDQADLDDDGDGDVCDIDIDGDGVANQADADPRDPSVGEPTPVPATPDPTAVPSTPEPSVAPAETESISPSEPAAALPTVDAEDAETPAAATPTEVPKPSATPTATSTTFPPTQPTPITSEPAQATPQRAEAAPDVAQSAANDRGEAQDESGSAPPPPQSLAADSADLASTITIDRGGDSDLVPLLGALAAVLAMGCMAMGVRSFRND